MEVAESVKKIQDVKKMLELARSMEEGSAKDYNIWANECAQNADSVSKKPFGMMNGGDIKKPALPT